MTLPSTLPPNGISPSVFTSQQLEPGSVYSRADLKARFDIHDATLNTGIFRPKGYDSVWLFITEHKTSDRTQYEDTLEGDTLRMQGQTMGRTDALILEHRQRGLELLVFYRKAKYELCGLAGVETVRITEEVRPCLPAPLGHLDYLDYLVPIWPFKKLPDRSSRIV